MDDQKKIRTKPIFTCPQTESEIPQLRHWWLRLYGETLMTRVSLCADRSLAVSGTVTITSHSQRQNNSPDCRTTIVRQLAGAGRLAAETAVHPHPYGSMH